MVAVFGDGWLPSLPSGWVLDRDLGDGWLPSSETGGCRLRPVPGSWSGISETGGCRLRRRVVAVPQVETKSGESYLDLRLVCAPVSWRLFPGVLCEGRPWPLAFCSGSVCGSGPVVCSWPCCVVWFRPPGLFQKEVLTQGTDPKTGFSDHGGRNKGRRPEDRSFNRYTLLRMGSIRLVRYNSGIGYVLWSFSWPLLSSSSPFSLCCSRSSSQIVLWGCSCCRRWRASAGGSRGDWRV